MSCNAIDESEEERVIQHISSLPVVKRRKQSNVALARILALHFRFVISEQHYALQLQERRRREVLTFGWQTDRLIAVRLRLVVTVSNPPKELLQDVVDDSLRVFDVKATSRTRVTLLTFRSPDKLLIECYVY